MKKRFISIGIVLIFMSYSAFAEFPEATSPRSNFFVKLTDFGQEKNVTIPLVIGKTSFYKLPSFEVKNITVDTPYIANSTQSLIADNI
jgi:hypothetical protein